MTGVRYVSHHPLFPFHLVSDFATNATKMLLLSNPFRQVAIHPSNYLQNFSMYFLYSIQIPTNGLIMKDSVTETPEQVKVVQKRYVVFAPAVAYMGKHDEVLAIEYVRIRYSAMTPRSPK